MPSPEITVPTTKITLPDGMTPEDFHKVVDRDFVRPQEPDVPLILYDGV